MVAVGGLLVAAIVKIVGDKLGSAIGERASLAWKLRKHMEVMKETLETIGATLEDAEKRSVREKEVQLWLKRLKHAAYDISDMLDGFQEDATQMTGALAIAWRKNAQAKKMKQMIDELTNIKEQHTSFKFTHTTLAIVDQLPYDQRESTSDVNESYLISRDAEKKTLIDMLSAQRDKDETMIIPIYGLGGIGKTTLAGMIYNDTQFKKYDHRVWVYVSQVFDLKKIGKSIISQLSKEGRQQSTETLQEINQCISDLFPGKRILIVLDDIWEENYFELDKLKSDLLRVGKEGSVIDVIVTTRKEDIANKICTSKPYKLQPMKDDMCWDIIKKFSQVELKSNKEQFVQIGLILAKNCGGVALAAQALGYMLKSKDLQEWSEINNSDIWNESSEDDNSPNEAVLPSLKLSYEKMPARLRLCFSYCAIFPKGHNIFENDLIQQWSALDFVNPSKGMQYIKQLLGMSFIQHSNLPSISGQPVVQYTMHDLVHDLARSVLGDELAVFDGSTNTNNTSEQKYCRYALITNYSRSMKLSKILPSKIRALHVADSSKVELPDGAFSFAKFLRILDFSGCSSILLPASMGQLKQLKCFIAPGIQNERLKECIAELSKLQYLNLYGSSEIIVLPESIGKLGCLVYMGLSGCSGISKLAGSFGHLKSMQRLDISGCSGISNLPVSFGYLKSLLHLNMPRCSGLSSLPESFGDLKSLVHLNMSYCYRIKELPGSIGNLINLQHMDLSGCMGIKEIPESVCGLTKLQYLDLSAVHALQRLPETIGSLVNLQYVNLSRCWKLEQLPESFQNLRNLVHLDLRNSGFEDGLSTALLGLTTLQYLDISCFYNRGPSVVDFIGTLTSLEHLNLSNNTQLLYLPESIGNLKRLHTLDLSACKKLKTLPESIGSITLKSLRTDGCTDELIDQVNSRLDYSLTLPFFKVRSADASDCSNLHKLVGVDTGELQICTLENVRYLDEAYRIKLMDKQNLRYLSLAWTLDAGRCLEDKEDKDLLGQLVPPRGLVYLRLEGYSSISFPSWLMDISHYLPNLDYISLINLPTCSNLPPLGQLPNLKTLNLIDLPSITKIDRDFCGGNRAFRQLSRLWMWRMEGLEEWNTTYSGERGVEEFMFPVLDELGISNCPRLRIKPCPPMFRECEIEKSDQVIASLEELDTSFHVSSTRSTKLAVGQSMCQSLRLFHHFPAIQELKLECFDLVSWPEGIRHLTSLRSLHLSMCGRISIMPGLPEWLGELSSLRSLSIVGCYSIESLPPSIHRLTKLQNLIIRQNTKLKQWCESEENKKILAHINNIVYDD
ncbi:hypothetical protein ACP4OV_027944 [Aristida adscensionis]